MPDKLNFIWDIIKEHIPKHSKRIRNFYDGQSDIPYDSRISECPFEKRISISTGIYPYIKEITLWEDCLNRHGMQARLITTLREEPDVYTQDAKLSLELENGTLFDNDIFDNQDAIDILTPIVSELGASVEQIETLKVLIIQQGSVKQIGEKF